ncbi:MAG: cohesin domain-containing protein [Blastocatellia bacterium]|nr:cohesin domain-containing protein [Blastocatellia bacterium]
MFDRMTRKSLQRYWRGALLLALSFAAMTAMTRHFAGRAAEPTQTNLLQNGGFEAGPDGLALTSLPGWSVTRGTVDVIAGAPNNQPAAEGAKHLDLIGSPGVGRIQQTFPTTPGTRYVFSGWIAHHPAVPEAGANAYLNGSAALPLHHNTPNSPSDLKWTPFSREFVASSSQTTLVLEDRNLAGYENGGTYFDGLRVLPVGAQGNAQVTAHRMTAGPIPNSCDPPAARAVFAPTDVRAFQWTFFSGVRIGDVLKWEFVQPNGATYLTRQEASPYAGNVCGWELIDIAGQAAASLPGRWQVRVYLNNTLMVTESFTITGGVPQTGAAIIIDGTDANDHGQASGGKNVRGWLYMQKALESLSTMISPETAKVVVDLGTSSGEARRALDSAFDLSTLKNSGWTIVHIDGAANIGNWLANLSTANTGILYLPTYNLTGGDLERDEMDAINAQAGRIANFVNRGSGFGGGLFAMGETNVGNETRAWGWLRALMPALNFEDESAGSDLELTPEGVMAFPGLSDPDLDLKSGELWHNHFTGDLGPLKVLATAPDRNRVTRNVIIGGIGIVIEPPSCPTITGISPASAAAGASVTITGSNLMGVTAVTFANNVSANFTVVSNTQIRATVPAGAVSGPVTISKPGCSDAQIAFTVPTVGSRTLRVGCGSGSPGGQVTLPIELVSLGDENALGFSIQFDPAILSVASVARGGDAGSALINTNTGQLAQGRLGAALALPSGQAFAAGTRQVATVTFNIAANTSATSTAVSFGDAPIRRQVANANAVTLPAEYQGCASVRIIIGGYEADVTPRPIGKRDGTVSINDWVMTGRFAAGLDIAAVGAEFQRADCSPRATRGDGFIDITDWVQAGRYAAGLDPVVPADGPAAPSQATRGAGPAAARRATALHGRDIRVSNASLPRGQTGPVAVEIEAEGNENALGFTLTFDPNALAFVSAAADPGLGNALVNVNATAAAQGRVGIALALGAGEKLKAGKQTILLARFTALSSGSAATTEIGFGDQPIRRQVVDLNANSVDAHFVAGTISLAAVSPVSSVSAASFRADAAPESIMAAFGASLATAVQVASQTPLPTSLAGTTVTVRDNAGVERPAPLFFVAPSQVNFLLPAGSAAGAATVTIRSGAGAVSAGTVTIAGVAPSLFTANANGQGVAAAVLLRVKADGSQVYETVARFDAGLNRFVPVAIDPGPAGDQLFLILYGTGLRHRGSLAQVSALAGGLPAEALFAGAVDGFAGLDQLNLRLPRALAGRGLIDVLVTAENRTANAVQVMFGN